MKAGILAAVPDAYDFDRPIHGKRHKHWDVAVARLAEAQHGVVARRQLAAAGLTPEAIDHRLRSGRLHCLYRGVYAVGHRVLSREARWMAAVLAAGPNAVLSHRSAGALWGLRRWQGAVDVTVPSSRHRRPGISWHVTRLPTDEVTSLTAIPVTTVPRTLLDLAGVLDHRGVERAINEAEVQGYTDPLSLPALIARYPRRRGTTTIRAILVAGGIGTTRTKSDLEECFLSFVRTRGLPQPELNAPIHLGDRFVEVDCLWRRQRLIVELDGRDTHDTAAAFEADRARDRALTAEGWRIVRVTWRHLHEDADQLAHDLRLLTAGERREGGP
jgi:very-short-patch-repair endonuclease